MLVSGFVGAWGTEVVVGAVQCTTHFFWSSAPCLRRLQPAHQQRREQRSEGRRGCRYGLAEGHRDELECQVAADDRRAEYHRQRRHLHGEQPEAPDSKPSTINKNPNPKTKTLNPISKPKPQIPQSQTKNPKS
jgi:hypothetical protein